MLKFLGISVHCAYEVCIHNHGEEKTFRHRTQDGVIDRQGFRTGRECESLEFDSCHVIASESSRIQGGSMSQQDDRVRFHALHQQLGVQKFECGLRIGLLAHQVERGPGFRQFDLQTDARQKDLLDVEQIAMQSPEKLQFLLPLSLSQRVMKPR